MSADLEKLKEDQKKLQEENKNLAEWKKLKEQLRQKFENKNDAYAGLKKEDAETLSKSNFESFSGPNIDAIFTQAASETLTKELFFKMWDSWESTLDENNHKLQIIEQKLQFQQQSPEKKKEQTAPSTSLDDLTTKLDTIVEKQAKQTEKKEVVPNPNDDCFSDLLSQKKEPKPDIELKIKTFEQKEQPLEYEEVSEYTDDDTPEPSKPQEGSGEGEKKEGEGEKKEGEGEKKEGEGEKKEGEGEKKEGESKPQGGEKKKKKKKVKKLKQNPDNAQKKDTGASKITASPQIKSFLDNKQNMGFIQKTSSPIIGGTQTTQKSFIPQQQQSTIKQSPAKARTSYSLYDTVYSQDQEQQQSSIGQFGSGRGRLLRDNIGSFVSDIFVSQVKSPQTQIQKRDQGSYRSSFQRTQQDRSYQSPGYFQAQRFGNQEVIKKVSTIRQLNTEVYDDRQGIFGNDSQDDFSNFQSPNSRKSSTVGRYSTSGGKSILNLERLKQEKEELAKLNAGNAEGQKDQNNEEKKEGTEQKKEDSKQEPKKEDEPKKEEEKKEEEGKKE